MASLDDSVLAGEVQLAALLGASEALLHEHKLAAFPLIEMRDAGDRGRGLFAKRDIAPGDVIMEESSFCWEVEEDEPAPVSSSTDSAPGKNALLRVPIGSDVAALDAQLLQMCPFQFNCSATAADMPTTLLRSEAAKRALASNSFGVRELGAVLDGEEGEPAAAAEAAGPAEYPARALFSVICLANHSCAPTARVAQRAGSGLDASNPPVYRMEARQPIPAGAEVTVSYVPRAWRQARRRAEISGTWGFSCACERCAAPYDDCVALRCSGCDDGLVYGGQAACSTCGAPPRAPAAAEASAPAKPPAGPAAGAGGPSDTSGAAGACRPAGDLDISDDDAVTAHLLAPLQVDGDVAAAVRGVLEHPLLAREDVRVWGAMNKLLGLLPTLCEQLGGENSEHGGPMVALYSEVATAVAQASLRTPYANPFDLGIEVEVSYE
jgi:hypothetical protein